MLASLPDKFVPVPQSRLHCVPECLCLEAEGCVYCCTNVRCLRLRPGHLH